MRVLLDTEPCETTATSVAGAIATAAAIAEERGRIVVEVVVDGSPWGQEQFRSPAACQSAAEEVQLVSADLRDLVRTTLADGANALVQADALQREAGELIQADQHRVAMERLGEAMGIWQSLHEAIVTSADALEMDLTLLQVGDGTIQDSVEQLGASLRTLRQTIQAKDPVGLADTLMYDLPDVVGEWRAVVQSMLDHIDATTGTDASSTDAS
ncbi:MAG: hypothetical protein HKO59_11025 [Phycisphaerales bacterium]|nr:hypothetical protein [Phycisphaerae bacterium]NNF44085.1 hypothetical protein [Phycisphaerales bacterium]NNM26496.1 hypothetical protein [Phycisphaerales bacterium]